MKETKEERLQTIIDNLGRHQQEVRASILQDAQQRLHNEGEVNITTDVDMESPSEQPDYQNFIKNVSASLPAGTPDPCPSHGTIVSVNPAIRQTVAPITIQHAQEAVEQVEAYDKNARQLREYYGKALERQRANRT